MTIDNTLIIHVVPGQGKVFRHKTDMIIARELYLPNEAALSQWVEIDETDEVDNEQEGALINVSSAILDKVSAIMEYDTSPAINSFLYNGQQLWVDRETRVSLRDTARIEAEAGMELSTLWTENGVITLPPTMIVQLLSEIEIYAHQCYNVTQQHIANVRSLTTLEEVEAYNFTQGYPQKLSFNQ